MPPAPPSRTFPLPASNSLNTESLFPLLLHRSDLFYEDPCLYQEQEGSDHTLAALGSILSLPRAALGVVAASRGLYIGDVSLGPSRPSAAASSSVAAAAAAGTGNGDRTTDTSGMVVGAIPAPHTYIKRPLQPGTGLGRISLSRPRICRQSHARADDESDADEHSLADQGSDDGDDADRWADDPSWAVAAADENGDISSSQQNAIGSLSQSSASSIGSLHSGAHESSARAAPRVPQRSGAPLSSFFPAPPSVRLGTRPSGGLPGLVWTAAASDGEPCVSVGRGVRFVLLVEKETVFQRLAALPLAAFPRHVHTHVLANAKAAGYRDFVDSNQPGAQVNGGALATISLAAALGCVVVTAKGSPNVGTRTLIQAMQHARPDLPFCALVDGDPYGIAIYLQHRFGTHGMVRDCPFGIKGLRFLGLRITDVGRLAKSAAPAPLGVGVGVGVGAGEAAGAGAGSSKIMLPMSRHDLAKCESLLFDPWFVELKADLVKRLERAVRRCRARGHIRHTQTRLAGKEARAAGPQPDGFALPECGAAWENIVTQWKRVIDDIDELVEVQGSRELEKTQCKGGCMDGQERLRLEQLVRQGTVYDAARQLVALADTVKMKAELECLGSLGETAFVDYIIGELQTQAPECVADIVPLPAMTMTRRNG